ncbi:MAG: glycosyltransferase family 39 protein [Armatimonadota bacterium]
MPEVYAFITQLSMLGAAVLFTRLLRPRDPVQFGLTFAVVISTFIVLLGYLLSAFTRFNALAWWAGGSALLLACIAVPVSIHPGARALCWRRISSLRSLEQRLAEAKSWRFEIVVLVALGIVTALVLLVNFVIILSLAPGNLDALCYHLPRMLYYLQQGSLRYYDANYWADIVHPKVSTILFAFTYLVSGKMANLTQLVQYFSGLVSMLAIYGSTRVLGANRRGSVLAALLFALLPICLTEAASAQNDMVLTAFIACTLYFLLVFWESRRLGHLALAAVAFALAFGVKANAVAVLPALLPLAVYLLLPRHGEQRAAAWRWTMVGLGALLLALALITLPAGYGENYRIFHHPFGPQQIRAQHSYEGVGLPRLLHFGSLNLLRYAANFLTLDGLEPMPGAVAVQTGIDAGVERLTQRLGINLAAPDGARMPFGYNYIHLILANENASYWGILGWLLLWPVTLAAAFGRGRAPALRLLAFGAVIFFVAQAFVSPYDAFRGRYFITGALFVLPAVAFLRLPPRTMVGRSLLALVLVLGGITGLCSLCYRMGTQVLPYYYPGGSSQSTFTMDGAAQLVRQGQQLYYLLLTYNAIVPEHAVVANDIRVAVPFPEYLLFGDPATRKVVPVRPWFGHPKPLPADAEYIVYSASSRNKWAEDVPLIKDDASFGTIYVHKLKEEKTGIKRKGTDKL